MDSDAPLDYAQFQLSPRRSHCELFVCGDGKTEKIASGLVKPFVTHLKVAEEQFAQATRSIKLQVERVKKARTWFKKGTLERFVRFVSTPEVLEIVHTFDSEMSQLEGARRIYSQGADYQLSGPSGESERLASASGDVTKKELLRAIDVRLGALKQDLTMACARASAAGFTLDTISELLPFSDHFGAHRLNEACETFSLFCQRHPDLATQHNHHHHQQQQQNQQISKSVIAPGDGDIRTSSDSDMSLDYPDDNLNGSTTITAPLRNSDKKASCTQSSSQQQQMQKSSVGQCSVEREGNGPRENDRVKDLEVIAPSSSTQPAGGSRRLSVQDRINLFESKQKEQAGSTSVLSGSGGGGGGGRTGGRPELWRLSSDVSSSVEKSVLRRWSGASDMGIDLGSGNSNHNKKEHESTATVRSDSSSTSFSSSSIQTASKSEEKDTATSQSTITLEEARPSMLRPKSRSFPKNIDQAEDALVKDEIDQGRQSTLLQGKGQVLQSNKESIQLSDQAFQQSQCASSSGMSRDTGLDEQRTAQTSSITVSTRVKPIESKAEAKSSAVNQIMLKGKEETHATQTSQVLNKADNVGLEEAALVSVSSAPSCAGVQGLNVQESLSKSQISWSKEEPKSNRRNPGNVEVQVRTGKREVAPSKGVYLASQLSQVTFPSSSKEISSNHVASSACEGPLRDLSKKATKETKARDLINLPNISSNPDDSMRFQNDRDESSISLQSLDLPASGKNMELSIDTCNSFRSSIEPVQISRPMKGNQELNIDLQTKADELEKLFAEHVLRVPGDLPSTKRGKPVDIVRDNHPKHAEKWPQEDLFRHPDDRSVEHVSNATEFDANRIFDIVNNHEICIGSKFGDLNFPEDFRGKFYEQYMQKRDMKLREEWRSTRASKEAKMKAMQDRLEQSRAEMKAKFSGSADRQNSAMLIQRRAEKLRSLSACSAMKTKRQPLKLWREGEEDLEGLMEQVRCGLIETLNDGSSKSTTYKKNLSSLSMSSTPRTSSITNNPTMEPTNIGFGRRRIPPENSLAQSVPNFSDLRKENTKPLSGTSKMTTRVHSRSSTRSKVSSENVTTVKEDKPRRSQCMRKGSASPVELSDLSSVNSDNLMVDQTDQGSESRPFLRKGKGIGPGAGPVVVKKKASMPPQNIKSEDDCAGPVEAMSNMVKEDEDFRTLASEVASRVENDSRPSADSVHSEDSESENGEASQLQDDPSPLAVNSSALKSSGEATQDSPEESPGSWSSRVHRSLSYVQEASDVDASVDSPIGSPASWGSHPLNQMVDSDAARMRKKWGAAQKPMFINSSLGQPKRDVTKGFKRLLKFGRKNKGQDALLPDWVSASTNSEGDEDPEDSRDTGNHMSDDMPKSRMGFSQYQSAYDGFPDGGLFQDEGHSLGTSIPAPPTNFKLREDHLSGSSLKAPRSFFSLSTFRSKGSESKLR